MLTEENEKLLLEKAQQAERICDYPDALKLYNQAAELYLSKEMVDEAAQVFKQLGYTKLYSADTGETAEESIKSKNESIKYFEKGKILFNQSHNKYGAMECRVGVFQTKLELAPSIQPFPQFGPSSPEVTNLVEKTRDLLLQLIDFYNKKDDKENLAAALAHLAHLALSPSPKPLMERNKTFQEGLEYANESWKISKEIGNSRILTESMSSELYLRYGQAYIQEYRWDPHWKEVYGDTLSRCNQTLKLIESKDDYRSLMFMYRNLNAMNFFYGIHFIKDEDKQKAFTEKGLRYNEKALDIARKINYKSFISTLLNFNAFQALYSGKINYLQKKLEDNTSEIEVLAKKFPRFLSSSFVNVYSTLSRWSFFNTAQRIEFAKKGIEYGEQFLKIVLDGEINDNEIYASFTSAYSQLALLTSDTNEQGIYLQKMLDNANKAYELGQKAKGGFIRSFGTYAMYNAYKTLADLAKNENEKVKFLTIAKEAAKNHTFLTIERTGMITAQLRIGLLIEELGIVSLNNDVLQEAKEYFFKAIDECVDRGYNSHAASAFQYVARIEDRLGNHLSSANNYEKSRDMYEDSLKNLEYKPLIKRIQEKIQYSSAWNLIENAKVHHKDENHLKAKEFYENASEILQKIPKYSFEGSYNAAWASLEEAELLSKQEKQEEAIKQYKHSIQAFEEAIKILGNALEKGGGQPERERIDKLQKVAKVRISYCNARINLDEARILGKTGDHSTAAAKYAMAASVFRNVCTRYKLDKERKELEAIYHLCRAWESMELAEKFEEPERFNQAANLFKEASNLFVDTKLKLLASGNSTFCQALEAGCKFDETLELEVKRDLYPKIKVMLSKAASSYGKGGFENVANWALATSIYFDAAWYLIQADKELNINEKGKLLSIGSNYLKSTLKLFSKAGYDNKVIEVQEKLNRVEKEESILFSALNTIKEPSISRSTMGISAPACPIESSQSPRLSEARQFSDEEKRVAIERMDRKKYQLVYRDLFKEYPKVQKRDCRVGIAQIGVSETGNIMKELFEMKSSGLLTVKENKIEEIRSKVKTMIEKAHNEGINILLFPEMSVDLNYGELLENISDLAKLYNMYIVPGSFHDQETKRNISRVFGPEGILWEQEKHIAAIINTGEGNRFKEGIEISSLPRRTIICNTEYGRIAIVICRDFLDMDLRVELKNFEPPIDIILNPAFTPVTADFKAAHFDARRSIYAYSFFANIGEFGESLIYTPEKDRTKRIIPAKEEGLIYKDIDLFKLRSARKKWEKEQKKETLFIQSTR
jgi:predicted amidohydrolase